MPTIPDFYSECEDALKFSLLELTDFFSEEYQVGSDDTAIARGGDYFIVLRPGSFPTFSSMNAGKIKDIDWGTVMDVYVRYVEYEKSWTAFKEFRAALFWKINNNPFLECKVQTSKSAKNVWQVNLSSDENAQYFRFSDDETQVPNFIIQTMSFTARQRVEFTEY